MRGRTALLESCEDLKKLVEHVLDSYCVPIRDFTRISARAEVVTRQQARGDVDAAVNQGGIVRVPLPTSSRASPPSRGRRSEADHDCRVGQYGCDRDCDDEVRGRRTGCAHDARREDVSQSFHVRRNQRQSDSEHPPLRARTKAPVPQIPRRTAHSNGRWLPPFRIAADTHAAAPTRGLSRVLAHAAERPKLANTRPRAQSRREEPERRAQSRRRRARSASSRAEAPKSTAVASSQRLR